MARAKDAERAARWGQRCSRLQAAHGPLLVADGAVWRLDVATLASDWFLSDAVAVPAGAVQVGREDHDRLRHALSEVAKTRRLPELIAAGHRPLRRFRGVDLDRLVEDATGFAERLAWALRAFDVSQTGTAPDGVLLAAETPAADRTPALASRLLARDATIAHRLGALLGDGLAERYMAAARGRWWPSPELTAMLETLASAARMVRSTEEFDAVRSSWRDQLAPWLTPERRGLLAAADSPGRFAEALGELFDRAATPECEKERRVALDLLLVSDAHVELPADASRAVVQSVSRLLMDAGKQWREAVRDDVSGWLEQSSPVDGWPADLPPALARRALAAWPVPDVSIGWPNTQRALGVYLDLLASADDGGGTWLRQRWVAELLVSDLSDGALGALAAAARAVPGADAACAALVAAIHPGRGDLRADLRRWARVEVAETDVTAISAVSGIEPELLSAYLHFRRLAGEKERFSGTLRKLLYPQERSREVEHIDAMLARRKFTDAQRSELKTRRRRLTDPHAIREFTATRQRLARRTLEHATSGYRAASLRKVLEGHARRVFPGLRPDLPIDLLADLVWLAGDEDVDAAILERFVDLALGTGSREEWPENRAWIERASGAFDVDEWLAGFDERRVVEGRTIRYVTERDPLVAVHLGSFFKTCLTLATGFSRDSALGNAVEVNRHVVYGRDASGDVVARKLIAVTSAGLIGYRTYTFSGHGEHHAALDEICRAFAQRCGLSVTTTGRPDQLTSLGFYDDGAEPWLTAEPTAALPPMREHLTDADVRTAPLDVETIHGLWLDRRLDIDQRRELVARSRRQPGGDEGWDIRFVPLIDPDGFVEVACRGNGERGSLYHLHVRPEPVIASALARIDTNLDSVLLSLLPVEQALTYLRDGYVQVPTDFLIRLLRSRGARPRDLYEAVRVGTNKEELELKPEPIRREQLLVAARSDAALRRGLANGSTAAEAARELALRGAASSAHAVARAAVRWPKDERVVLAALALGRTVARSAPLSPDTICDVVLVRLAAARGGLPEGALALAEDHQLAAIGDRAWPPAEEARRAAWVAARDLDSALAEARRGGWIHLRAAMGDLIRPLEDSRVLDLAFSCIDGPDEDLESFAITLAGAQRVALISSHGSAVTLAIFAGATHRGCLSTSAAHTVLEALWTMRTSAVDEALGIIDLLVDQLPDAEQLPALVGQPDRFGEPPELQWSLARRARVEPALVSAARVAAADVRRSIAAALSATLPPEESAQLVARLDLVPSPYAESASV